jgi:hypothetical protein
LLDRAHVTFGFSNEENMLGIAVFEAESSVGVVIADGPLNRKIFGMFCTSRQWTFDLIDLL